MTCHDLAAQSEHASNDRRSGAECWNAYSLVRRPRIYLLVTSISLLVTGLFPALCSVLEAVHHRRLIAIPGVLAYYGVVFGLKHTFDQWWREQRGQVRVDECGVWLGRRCVVRRSSIRHAFVLTEGTRRFLRVYGILPSIDIEIGDAEDGNAVLRAMRQDAARSVARYSATLGTHHQWIGAGAFLALLFTLSLIQAALEIPDLLLIGLVVGLAILANVHAASQQLRVSVGADGITLRPWIGRTRFLPFSSIETVQSTRRVIEIRARDGSCLTISQAARTWRDRFCKDHDADPQGLVARIQTQLAEHRAHRDGGVYTLQERPPGAAMGRRSRSRRRRARLFPHARASARGALADCRGSRRAADGARRCCRRAPRRAPRRRP